MDKDILYKQHILDAVAKIEQYVAGVSHENFLGNTMLQDAVVHELQIIGEAAKKLSPSFKKKYDLPWSGIAGTRDKIVHDYFQVDVETIWAIIQKDLSDLKQKLK